MDGSESSEVCESDDGCPHLSRATAVMFTGNKFGSLFKLVAQEHL